MSNIEGFLRKRKERAMPGNPNDIITHVSGERTPEVQTALDLAIMLRKDVEKALRTGEMASAKRNVFLAQKELNKCPCGMEESSVYTNDIALEQIKLQDVRGEVLSKMGDFQMALHVHQQALKWKEQLFKPGSEHIIKTMLNIAIALSYVATADEAEKAFDKTLQMAQKAEDCTTRLSLQVKIYIRYASTLFLVKVDSCVLQHGHLSYRQERVSIGRIMQRVFRLDHHNLFTYH